MSSLLAAGAGASDEYAGGSDDHFAPATFQGYLEKKSPKGFLGKHIWQRRFFILEKQALSYYKDKQQWAKQESPIGVIRVDMIRDIQVPVDSSHYGLRFDILAVGGHLFELMTPSEKSCTQWVRALRDELSKRRGSVSEMMRTVKDEQVADGYWKKGKKQEDVKAMHEHAEKAVPVPAGKRSRQHSRSHSRTFASPEEDEEARERAQALAVMMQEEQNTKAAKAEAAKAAAGDSDDAGSFASVFRKKQQQQNNISAPPSAGNTPPLAPQPSPTTVVFEDMSAEEKAQAFLKQQYSLGAGKVAGRGRSMATSVSPSASPASAATPASSSSGGPRRSPSNADAAGSEPPVLRSRSSSSAGDDGSSNNPAPPPPAKRRPIASYGDSDSDSDTETSRRKKAIASAAASSASVPGPDDVIIRLDESRTIEAAVAASSAASSSSSGAADANGSSAASSSSTGAELSSSATPFISSVLWKESPGGFFKPWQKRLFSLQEGVVCYYKSVDLGLQMSNLAGTIPVHQISKVSVVSGEANKRGTDFNLYTTEGRIYKLRSESGDVTKQWVAFIQACDPKRLGTTFPGLVVRAEAPSAAAGANGSSSNGSAPTGSPQPARPGRLMATSAPSGRVVVSVMPVGASSSSSSSSTVTSGASDAYGAGGNAESRAGGAAEINPSDLPPTRDQELAAEAIEERKTFWNFLRNKHSLLSVFYVKKKAAFPRAARLFLFTLDLLMNLFFVYTFIIYAHAHGGRPDPVQQVVAIIVILLVIEMIIGWGLKEFCFPRRISSVEQHIRLAGCAILLYGMFGALTAWKWTQLPQNAAIMALVRFILSSIGVVFAEAGVWFCLYSCATGCCPCLKLDDGKRSLEDIAAEEEEKARIEREQKHKEEIAAKRAKMQKKLDVKNKFQRDEDLV